jgi:endonuclease YncB( thermonuclease family)
MAETASGRPVRDHSVGALVGPAAATAGAPGREVAGLGPNFRAIARRFQIDSSERIVAQGLALAYRQYSRDYVAAEDEAQAAGRGMWAGSFEPPWEWRRRH